MESFKNFIIDHIDRVLEYLKQNPLTIFVRRSVDAYMAAYALAAALGETTHVAVADWPPQRGVCVGFRCDGFYIAEGEAGVDDAKLAVEPTSLSHMAVRKARRSGVRLPRYFVDVDKCVSCGICYNVLKCSAISKASGGKAYIDPALCVGCGVCAEVCPVGAIKGEGDRAKWLEVWRQA